MLGPPHLIEAAVERGWYDPADGPFDANAVYGDGKGRWDGVRWMEGELGDRADSGGLTLADVAWAVRTERLTGDSAGYGQIVPLDQPGHDELRLLWHAPIGPVAAPFTPFFCGVEAIPVELGRHRYLGEGEAESLVHARDDNPRSPVPQRVEATPSAVAVYRRLLHLLAEHHEQFLPEVTPVWEALERDLAVGPAEARDAAHLLLDAGRGDLARALLTRFASSSATDALALAAAMADSMDLRSRVLYGIRDEPGWRGPEQIW